MTQYRAVCPCGEASDPVASKLAVYRWVGDHNAMHASLDEDRRTIVVQEVVV